mgnify:FL=1
MRGRRGKEHIVFTIQMPEVASTVFMKSDAVMLQQLFYNLLDNAFKFTDEGQVNMGYTIENNAINFFVEDSGTGIPPNQQEHIFKRFRQLDYGPTKKYGGTGLGLAIVKGLIDLLDGHVEVSSESGRGTRFQFSLPGLILQANSRPSAPMVVTPKTNWSAYTILVVDRKSVV